MHSLIPLHKPDRPTIDYEAIRRRRDERRENARLRRAMPHTVFTCPYCGRVVEPGEACGECGI